MLCLPPHLPESKRGQHSGAPSGACGPVFYPRKNQQDGGLCFPLFPLIRLQQGLYSKSSSNSCSLYSRSGCAAEQNAWREREKPAFTFWKAVIKWGVFLRSWICFMRRLCTRWSTGSAFLRPNTWRVTRSCLLTCGRYLSAFWSTCPAWLRNSSAEQTAAALNICQRRQWQPFRKHYLLWGGCKNPSRCPWLKTD